jgi:PAS domain-containing protein
VGERAVASLGPEALTAALEALPDGVAIFDTDWTVRFINQAAAALLGYDPGWPGLFRREADRLRPVLGDAALRIEHVGARTW